MILSKKNKKIHWVKGWKKGKYLRLIKMNKSRNLIMVLMKCKEINNNKLKIMKQIEKKKKIKIYNLKFRIKQ